MNLGEPEMMRILGVSFDNLSMGEILGQIRDFVQEGSPRTIFTPNVDFLMLARHDPEFLQILNAADLSICDSVPLLWASRLLGTPLKARVTGSDLFPAGCELAAREGYRVYFLGAAPGVAARAAQILTERYPRLRVVGVHAPPMGFNGNQLESRDIMETIRNAGPDILFVGLGTPKQERWIHRYRDELEVPVSIGVGSSFDFVAGVLRRAPRWVQRIGLEWLFRLCLEPRRLYRRYLLRDAPFVAIVLQEWIRNRLAGGDRGARAMAIHGRQLRAAQQGKFSRGKDAFRN